VFKAEDSRLGGHGIETSPISMIHLDYIKAWSKKRYNGIFQPTCHCCMCCNPVINGGRVDFEDGWLIKPSKSFKTKDKHEACQLTRTKVQQQQQKKEFKT
jgi:hypothetical protein